MKNDVISRSHMQTDSTSTEENCVMTVKRFVLPRAKDIGQLIKADFDKFQKVLVPHRAVLGYIYVVVCLWEAQVWKGPMIQSVWNPGTNDVRQSP